MVHITDHGSTKGALSTTSPTIPVEGSSRGIVQLRRSNPKPTFVKVSTHGSVGGFDPSLPDIQAEIKNFEAFSKAYEATHKHDQIVEEYNAVLDGSPHKMIERMSGYPNPKLYDQFYINKYSFPKGL